MAASVSIGSKQYEHISQDVNTRNKSMCVSACNKVYISGSFLDNVVRHVSVTWKNKLYERFPHLCHRTGLALWRSEEHVDGTTGLYQDEH